ncbi:unnamed protein product [Polarella glacialis]|uniref:Sucrose phosphatase-like domain-containing protein n=1 Tax=Polarella glacialis TaxID=89957 RepID=A0A813HW66_POLGL|nr:unnamed protein product [Polarella glacialis]
MPITLYYHSGWERCQIHGCPRGDAAWRDILFEETPEHAGWKHLKIEADGVEFVVCDLAKQSWDNPPASYGKPNYLIEESGIYTLRSGCLRRLRKQRVLVVTDLDHTLVGHGLDPEDIHLEEFRSVWLGEFALNGSALAYSTGRNREMALDVAAERGLPRPDLLICGVGTEVYAVPSHLPVMGWWEEARSCLELVPEWKARMLKDFDRVAAEATLREAFPEFEVRGTPEHDPYRIPTAYEVDEAFEGSKERLRAALGPAYQVISSGDGAWKLIDVCPAEAGKLKAMQFAMQTLGFGPSETLACGDSGNDELMYRCSGARAVMVSNALPELVMALSAASKNGTPLQKGVSFETTHGSLVLYSSREVAGGIVEALSHFWPQNGGV